MTVSAPFAVVGFDGSEGSLPAMRWAVAHADLFGPPRPVMVWRYPAALWGTTFAGGETIGVDVMQEGAEAALAEALAEFGDIETAEPVVVQGDPAVRLVKEAGGAGLLVVGSRGYGALRSRLLGSVGVYCVDHSTVPVVIVPHGAGRDEGFDGPRRVVVGIDGSDNADAALRWALGHVRADDEVVAVAAWHPTATLGYESIDAEAELLEQAATEAVDEAVHRIAGELGVDAGRVRREHERGDPRTVLRRRADDADLLVVGARGRTGVSHLLVGSTASSLAHRPICPVAVVPLDR